MSGILSSFPSVFKITEIILYYLLLTHYSPIKPDLMDWSALYPQYFSGNTEETQRRVEFADIGCGYGGLLGNFSFLI